MSKPNNTPLRLTASPVYLAADAINNLVRSLPTGTAYFIGVVLLTMCTGQLVHHQGSLARAALPYVAHLRWGWHRVERASERGSFCLDALFDRAAAWCVAHLPVEPVRLGGEQRTVHAIDSSTIARWRSRKASALLGKGYCQRAQRAVRANIVAALTSVVRIRGVRVGLVTRTRFGQRCEEAVAALFGDLPESADHRLFSVDAGIATCEQFAAACEVLPMGPWDRNAAGTAGRLANHLDLYASTFAALALSGVTPRKYGKNGETKQTNDLQLPKAA